MFVLFLAAAFVLQSEVVKGWRLFRYPLHQQGRLLFMAAGKGFERTEEVEITLDDTSKQDEKDLIGMTLLSYTTIAY